MVMISLIGIPRDANERFNYINNSSAYPANSLVISSSKPNITLNTYFGLISLAPVGEASHRSSILCSPQRRNIGGESMWEKNNLIIIRA